MDALSSCNLRLLQRWGSALRALTATLGNREHLRRPTQFALQRRPREPRSRIVLAPRRDVLVPGDVRDRILLRDGGADDAERLVLRGLEGLALQPFELDATESSLQFSRPRYADRPACHARASQLTNCSSAPSRRMKKCADTCMPRICWK